MSLTHNRYVGLDLYVRDNVVQNAGHYLESKPRQPLKGIIFDNDRRRSIHYLHGYLPKRNNIFTQCVFLQLPIVVLISREIVRQRRWG